MRQTILSFLALVGCATSTPAEPCPAPIGSYEFRVAHSDGDRFCVAGVLELDGRTVALDGELASEAPSGCTLESTVTDDACAHQVRITCPGSTAGPSVILFEVADVVGDGSRLEGTITYENRTADGFECREVFDVIYERL